MSETKIPLHLQKVEWIFAAIEELECNFEERCFVSDNYAFTGWQRDISNVVDEVSAAELVQRKLEEYRDQA